MSYNINAINDYTYGNFTIKIIINLNIVLHLWTFKNADFFCTFFY